MKKQAKILMIVMLASGILFSGCGKEEEPAAPAMDQPPADAAVAPDTVVARVGETVITGQMLNQQLNALIQQYSAQVPPEQLQQLQPMLRQQAVEALINQDLLLKEAIRQDITPTEEEIDSQIEEIVAQFPSRAAFESQLGMAGLTMDALREDIRRNLMIQQLVESQFPEDLETTDEEIEEFYAANTEQFEQPEQVEASHILIQVAPDASEEDKAAKLEEIEAIQVRLEGGEDFAVVAGETSQDAGSAERGGSLGFFGRGQMIPAFEEVAFSLEPGELSEIVETQFGYHLITVSDKREAGTVPLEEVSEQIGVFLTNQKQQQLIGDYLKELREGVDIEYGPGFQPAPPPVPAGQGQFPPARPPQ
jgi:peptidyl-prolyl cis-trans isomerase C